MSAFRTAIIAAAALALTAAAAQAETQLTWYGHSAYKLTTPSGKVVLIDPWIANPANPEGKQALAALDKADLILVTHGHGDHIGNSVEIAKKTGAHLVATFDLMRAMVDHLGFPKEQATMATAGNFGGEIALLDGEVKVAFVPAIHGSDIDIPSGLPDEGAHVPGGPPGAFLVTVKDGPAIYHAGDTDLFGDMSLVPRFRPVDVMLAPIGDKFTMGPSRAAAAVKMVEPKTVIPMHYGTFPVLTGTPEQFGEALKKEGASAEMKVMKPGETLKF